MPQLGESVTEGTVSKWLVTPGDQINKYDPLAEIMTDKVNAEVPSLFSGVVKEIIVAEGETVAVGESICTIKIESVEEAKNTIEKEYEHRVTDQHLDTVSTHNRNKYRYSPAVLKLSREHGIDLTQVEGSGAGGRITRKDLLNLIDSGNHPLHHKVASMSPKKVKERRVEKIAQSATPVVRKDTSSIKVDTEIIVSGVRKTIAANMLRSKQEIPHAWTMIEVDVTNLVNYRNQLKVDFAKKEGFPLTFFPFFVKAVAQGLKEFPQINSMWAGDKIVRKQAINISIAVATDDALYVPVIQHADEKTIKGIAREIADLSNKVRLGKLTVDDMQGGTFTVNNTGSFGSVQSMGIINYPQAAILQVEAIVKRPVIIDGMIAVRDMVNLCMSLDHRVLDGLICARFLQRVKEILENISQKTTPIY